jgi:hypothetical protein
MNKVTDPDDQQAIIESARVVYRLYGDMLHNIPLPARTASPGFRRFLNSGVLS